MNLQELKSALPKPWLTINAEQTDTKTALSSVEVTQVPAGALVFTLTPQQLISSIIEIAAGRTTSIGVPSNAAIDAYLGSAAVDGVGFAARIINREPTNNLSLGVALIPKSGAGGFHSTPLMYFKRQGGVYLQLNA